MPTGNEILRDALLRHQIHLMRLAGQLRNETNAILRRTEPRLRQLIEDRLETLSGENVDFTKPSTRIRVRALEQQIAKLRGDAFIQVQNLWNQELRSLMTAESLFLPAAIRTSMPVQLTFAEVAPERLRALLTSDPFQGGTLKEWARGLRARDINNINTTIRTGLIDGLSGQDIARQVIGTNRFQYKDGRLQVTRNSVQAVTRTAVNHFANAARSEFAAANTDLIQTEQYLATLDNRTTPICRSLDGETFEVKKGPHPPQHINCRSIRIPIMNGEAMGERPAKPVTERMLVDEYAMQNRLGRISGRSNLPRGHKGAYDRFARRRTRELVGRVPAKTTYQEWLKTQSREFQDDVLGPTRGKLFRKGGLDLKRFVNRAGDELTLRELAIKDANAFRAAGLDPADFN